jgi:hypothetical protein
VSWIQSRIAAWKEKPAVVRALWTTLGLLAGSTLVVSITAYAAVSATRAVFPPVSEETLATGAPASEVDAEGTDAAAAPKPGTAKGSPADAATRKAGARTGLPVKRTQARRGESTE